MVNARYLALLAAVGLERLFELGLSGATRAWAFARGGIEFGAGHFGCMKALHTAFLFACAAEVVLLQRAVLPALAAPMLAAAGLAQALRYWAICTLGPRWNVRVIVVPGDPVVTRGPYRFAAPSQLRRGRDRGHRTPADPHGVAHRAASSALANAVLLAVRIRCEERALARHTRLPRGARRSRAFRTARPAQALTDSDVAIAGGGPVGLATAIFARARGPARDRARALARRPGRQGVRRGDHAARRRALARDRRRAARAIRSRVSGSSCAGASRRARFPGEPGRGVRRTALVEALRARARALGVELADGCARA